jgi:large subunit ribosomal protein L4e
MKAHVYDMDGKAGKEITLPNVFNEPVRPDLINRASLAMRSAQFQAKGTDTLAGLQTSAEYIGRRRKYHAMIGRSRGMAKLPHIKEPKGGLGEVRIVPQARTGRRAHPPKPEKKLRERINKKERKKAIKSAIAATGKKALVEKRGHKVEKIKELPIVVTDAIEKVSKTKDLREILKKLNLDVDLKRTEKKTTRAGRGRMRGRKYRKKKGVLIVIGKNEGIVKAASNIAGADVCIAKNLNAELLAPGGTPGRLAIYSESAVEALKNFK